jgi:hypothetical protein
MNTYEKNKMAIFHAANAVLTQHQSVVDALPPLAEAAVKFRGSVDEIEERDTRYTTITVGSTAAKNSAIDKAASFTLRFSNALYALGRKTGNEQLKGECRITMSELMHKREGEFEQFCLRVAELAKSFSADIAVYGITAEEIDAYEKALATYRQLADSMQQKFAESKATREALHDSFKAADDILKEDLDTMVEMIKEGNPDFYRQYMAARTIRDIGGGHAAKNGTTESVETVEEAPVAEPAGA